MFVCEYVCVWSVHICFRDFVVLQKTTLPSLCGKTEWRQKNKIVVVYVCVLLTSS